MQRQLKQGSESSRCTSEGIDSVTCHPYQGALSSNGYGAAWLDGKFIGAHRKAYLLHHNLRPEDIVGKVIRHTCDNKKCVNPEHLLLGTHDDNMQDMVDRGLQGVKPALTMEQAREIRARHVPGTRGKPNPDGQRALGREYNVPQSVIRQIVLNITYKE